MKSPLQAIRAERHWSQADLAKLMREQAQREGISQIPPKAALVTSISRWENDHCTPSETYRSLLRHVTGLTDVELGFTRPPEDPIAPVPHAQADELRMDLDAARQVDAECRTSLNLRMLASLSVRMVRALRTPPSACSAAFVLS